MVNPNIETIFDPRTERIRKAFGESCNQIARQLKEDVKNLNKKETDKMKNNNLDKIEGTFKIKRVGNGYITTVESDGIIKQEVDKHNGYQMVSVLIEKILIDIETDGERKEYIAELERKLEEAKSD